MRWFRRIMAILYTFAQLVLLWYRFSSLAYNLTNDSSIGIIGAADIPTIWFLATKLTIPLIISILSVLEYLACTVLLIAALLLTAFRGSGKWRALTNKTPLLPIGLVQQLVWYISATQSILMPKYQLLSELQLLETAIPHWLPVLFGVLTLLTLLSVLPFQKAKEVES